MNGAENLQSLSAEQIAALLRLLQREDKAPAPLFGDYLKKFYQTYKLDQESNTIINRNRIIKNHVLPNFGDKRIDEIQTIDLQQYFNRFGQTHAKETAMKIKNVMLPVFASAVEDGIILRNPFQSKRLEITGRDTMPHKAIPKEKFDAMKAGLLEMPWQERIMGGLLCYTGMRFEEVLGAKWGDVSDDWITVERAVVHPTRNKPEVKSPKTKTSKRKIPLHPGLKAILDSYDGDRTGYMLHAKDGNPISYTQARSTLRRIRERFGIKEYSAHDFRDTCATTWRENGIPLDVIARMLGHSKTEVTEKRYVKYRDELIEEVRDLM